MKKIIIIILAIVLVVGAFIGYRAYIFKKYMYEKPDNVEDIVKGLKERHKIKINKQEKQEEEFLAFDGYTIRNDFKDYERVISDPNSAVQYYNYEKEVEGKKYTINFGMEKGEFDHYQYIDMFKMHDATFYGTGNSSIEKKYNSVDKSKFLKRNNIKNDIDFLKFIADNYYIQNDKFMSRSTMRENYAFNVFVDIAIPKVDEFVIIDGDYQGYILKNINGKNQITQITIINDGKAYGIFTNDPKFKNEDYIIDLVSTINIL